ARWPRKAAGRRGGRTRRGKCGAARIRWGDSWSTELVEGGGKEMAEPDREQTENDRAGDVAAGSHPFAIARQVEGLQAEGGEGRIPTADADHEKRPSAAADEPAPVRPGEGAKETDEEGAGEIDQERAPGKSFAPVRRHDAVQPEAEHAAERAAECDQKIELHDEPL